MSTRDRMIRAIKERLRRRKQDADDVDLRMLREGKASRVVMPRWARTYGEVVQAENLDASYLRKVADRDWDNVIKGRNRE